MSKNSRRLPLSVTNIVLVSTFLAGAIASALLRNWLPTGLLLALGLGGLLAALYARRAGSRDITRINAIEYSDERDRMLARKGFAVVGAVALALSVVELVIAAMFTDYYWIASIQLLVLSVTWGVANSLAVRES
ncbi:hypothetical protein BH11ACT4_BH11ACT4_12840 [soil metagenome]